MSWYKKAVEYGYHGTDPTQIENIRLNGLKPKSFFAGNEADISPYTDGVWLRFPFPEKYNKRIRVGDYYTTIDVIPPNVIEIKTDAWGEYQRI